MAEEKIKRNTAYKLRIGAILSGRSKMENERFLWLELGGKNIVRINLIGNIVDKYESEGEKRYCFTTLDDGSGQIKMKSFGDDSENLKDIKQGQTVLVIGTLRSFNNEVYISPEIVRETDPKYLLIRKMETNKEENINVQKPEVQEQKNGGEEGLSKKILGIIRNAEEKGGILTEEIASLLNISEEVIAKETQRFIEEGVIFEPRPGKVRWLG